MEIVPLPPPRVVAIDLAPAACRLPRMTVADVARIRVEARMNVAEMRGRRDLGLVRRIVIIAPEPPATL